MAHKSPGRKLQEARMKRGLTIEEAARASKVRVERLRDLENDDYSNFPSLVYARNFIILYAKHLGVDLSDELEEMGRPSGFGTGGYSYLSSMPDEEPARRQRPVFGPRFSLYGFIIGFGLILLLLLAAYLFIKINLDRLEPGRRRAAIVTQETPPPAPRQEPEPVEVPAEAAPPAAVPAAAEEEEQTEQADVEYDLEIRPKGRTFLQVVKDQQDAEPAFDDILEGDEEPLLFRGRRFWIKLSEPQNVEILQDGEPYDGTNPRIVVD